MIVLVAIAVSAVGWLSYRSLEQALLPRVLDRIETHSRFVASELESHVRSGRGDIATFHGLAAVDGLMRARLNGGIDPVDRHPRGALARTAGKPGWPPRCRSSRPIRSASSGSRMATAKSSASTARARTARSASCRKRSCKQVGDAPYFRDTIRLAPDEIYVSPVDLNAENGVIETPHVPTMRIAMPVLAPDGKPFGIVIVNVDMRPALDRVRSSVRPARSIYVVDARGDYLVHPDRAREFGSQLGRPTDWRNDFPDLAASIGTTQSVAQIVPNQAGRPGGVALAPALLAGSEWVAVIESVPNAVFMAPAQAIQKSSIPVGLIAVLCATVLALLIARSLTRPIVQLTGPSRAPPAAARPRSRSTRAARPACWRARSRR